jgi:hypothetical protein
LSNLLFTSPFCKIELDSTKILRNPLIATMSIHVLLFFWTALISWLVWELTTRELQKYANSMAWMWLNTYGLHNFSCAIYIEHLSPMKYGHSSDYTFSGVRQASVSNTNTIMTLMITLNYVNFSNYCQYRPVSVHVVSSIVFLSVSMVHSLSLYICLIPVGIACLI